MIYGRQSQQGLFVHIDTLLNSVKQQAKTKDGNIILSVDNEWAQGRTLYSGISASLVYQAMLEAVDTEKVMRSLSTNFIGPIEADTEVNIIVEILREGKNVTRVVGRLLQGNKVAVMCQASFGIARQSEVIVANNLRHKMDYPQEPDYTPQITQGDA